MNSITKSPVRDKILVEKTTPIKPLSRRDKICRGNIAYLTARFVAGASVFYQYIIPNGIGRIESLMSNSLMSNSLKKVRDRILVERTIHAQPPRPPRRGGLLRHSVKNTDLNIAAPSLHIPPFGGLGGAKTITNLNQKLYKV